MTSIGSLVADLRLESAAFHRDLGRASSAMATSAAQMQRHMRAIERSAGGVGKAVGELRTGFLALGSALAVRQFTNWTKSALDTADAIAKTADAVGLSTDALQEYRTAAGLSGVSTDKFDTALQRFVRSIGEAREGTGSLVEALKGTDSQFLRQIKTAGSTEQALDLVFKRMAAIPDAAGRAAFATAAFGREGIRMTGIVRDGVGGLIDMRKQARELGVVLEESLIRKAEAVGDRMQLLRQAFETGFARSIIMEFAGSFELTKENIKAVVAAGEQFGRIVGQAMKAVAEAAEFVGRNIQFIAAALAALVAMKAAALFAGIATALFTFGEALKKAAVAQGALNILMAANPALRLAAAIAALVIVFDQLSPPTDKLAAAQEQLRLIDEQIASIQSATAQGLFMFGSEGQNEKRLEQLQQQRAAVVAALEKMKVAADEVKKAAEGGAAAVSKLTGAQTAFLDNLQREVAALQNEKMALGLSGEAVEAARLAQEIYTEQLKAGIDVIHAETEAKRLGIPVTELLTEAELKAAKSIAFSVAERRKLNKEIAQANRIGGLKDSVEIAQAELRLLGATAQERAVQIRLLETELRLKRDGIDLTSEAAREELALTRQLAESQARLEKAHDERREQLEKIREEREMMLEPFRNAVRGIQEAFGGDFEEFPADVLADPATRAIIDAAIMEIRA